MSTLPAAAAGAAVNFGDLGFYSSGGFLPDGNYVLHYTTELYQPKKKTGEVVGEVRLGVMMRAYDINEIVNNPDPTKLPEPKMQHLSMGSNAHQSFMPGPDGFTLVQVPNGPGANLNDQTNWAFHLQSLYNVGLPPGVFVGNVQVLSGLWAHVTSVPEPESRKGMRANAPKTSEVAGAEPEKRKDNKIAIISEILPGGAPWEGGGGFDPAKLRAIASVAPIKQPARPVAMPVTPATAPVAVPMAVPGPRPVALPGPVAVPAPAFAGPVAVPAGPRPVVVPQAAPAPVNGQAALAHDPTDLQSAALNSVVAVLGVPANAGGMARIGLRALSFNHANSTYGAETAQAIATSFFENDTQFNGLLGTIGYRLDGPNVVPNA